MPANAVIVPAPRRKARLAAVLTTTGLVASLGLLGGAAAVAAGSAVTIVKDDIGVSYATDGDISWFGDALSGASFNTTWDTFDGAAGLRLDAPADTSQVRVQKTYGPDVRPDDIRALLAGASYTYTGSNVVFALELFFTPADPQYGPDGGGATKCLQAKDAGVTLPGQCYTSIKWEPLLNSDGAWKTVDLTADTAANSATSTGGWKNTQRIGVYEKPGALVGNTLTEYLAQMTDYTIVSAGVQLGSGTANLLGWVKNATFDGVSYGFAPKPEVAADAPASSSEELDSKGYDDTTSGFTPSGGSAASGSVPVNSGELFSGELDWADSTDEFVDVYAYSTPILLGTFPVVNGKVVMTGVDLSALEAGGHRLVFIGQTSDSVQVVAISIKALAVTGSEVVLPLAVGSLSLLMLGAFLVLRHRQVQRRNS